MGYRVFLVFMYFKHSFNSLAGVDHHTVDRGSKAVTGLSGIRLALPGGCGPHSSRHRGGERLLEERWGGSVGWSHVPQHYIHGERVHKQKWVCASWGSLPSGKWCSALMECFWCRAQCAALLGWPAAAKVLPSAAVLGVSSKCTCITLKLLCQIFCQFSCFP